MSVRIVVSASDEARMAAVTEVVGQAPGVEILGTTAGGEELAEMVVAATADVVVIDAGTDPGAAVARSRELTVSVGDVGVVMLAGDPQPDLLEAARSAGVHTVVALPADPQQLSAAITAAGRSAPRADADDPEARDESHPSAGSPGAPGAPTTGDEGDRGRRPPGRIVVFAGSKGGVGTTTLATHLAMLLHDPQDLRVALVDLDLQTGDVRNLLDIWHTRTVTDLTAPSADWEDDVAASLYPHRSGVQVLLAPKLGEQGDTVGSDTVRATLATLRARFDLVLVDVGAIASEANVAATQVADEVVVVMTPDVPSLKGTNRLLALWERLGVRHGDVRALVNRFSKRIEVKPELIRRVVETDVLDTMLPADYGALDAATNSGIPDRITSGRLHDGLLDLIDELELRGAAVARPRSWWRRR